LNPPPCILESTPCILECTPCILESTGKGNDADYVASKTGKSGIDEEEEELDSDDEEDEEEDDKDEKSVVKGKPRSWLASMVRGVVGSSTLELEDVAPILEALQTKLMSKNVAQQIAAK
jgi:signal recognition particle GTPase